MRFEDQNGARLEVLGGIDLDIRPGEFLSILGPSGCGKSTLLKILGGIVEPTSGTVEVDRRRLAYVFQQPVFLPWRNVLGNVTFSRECRGERARDVRNDAVRLLEEMGLGEVLDFSPWQLSLGMLQRLDLARALFVRPAILLADEPFASLDLNARAAMCRLLIEVWRSQGFTVVFVSHDPEEAAYLSDRVVFLTDKPARVLHEVEIDLPRPRIGTPEKAMALFRVAESLRRMVGTISGTVIAPGPRGGS